MDHPPFFRFPEPKCKDCGKKPRCKITPMRTDAVRGRLHKKLMGAADMQRGEIERANAMLAMVVDAEKGRYCEHCMMVLEQWIS